ncbi:MAG: HsdR family type I site-specific deoxyribonuclease [Deltaproteobacteria bacterium]|nr:HsdR family type I site-specific deoxyribonuclease [Myxococcales bacterium]MDP3217859.1 HsdR family type I site-specific deoxyribonuclease [Deltaproteobacteria bacterium]
MATTTHEPDVESVVIQLLQAAGWSAINAQAETFGPDGTLGRANRRETVLVPRLRAALTRLNPDVPSAALDRAVEDLSVDRSAQQLADANHTLYLMVKDGVRVSLPDPSGAPKTHVVRVVDWDSPAQNDFLLVQQLWVAGAVQDYRADLVGFVNGLPWLFIELKNVNHNTQEAFTKNLATYRENIPQLFWHNAVVVLSNGLDAVMGSLTSSWDRFKAWTRVDSEEDAPGPSLDGVIRGALTPARLLDLVENFVLFEGTGGSAKKVIAQNHQMLGVNRAVAAVERYRRGLDDPSTSAASMEGLRRLGVFWHTQGSGKSYSMVFFSQKVLRKVTGNWSFVVVTDREELDDQIYKTFKLNGAVGAEDKARATSATNLRTMLSGNQRFVFTLIQKFRTESQGQAFPKLSDRAEYIVMADEAHRSQYDTFAINMRLALPHAAFIGFTGTPLLQGDQTTREVFGDYVSRYRFFDAVRDGATVPLYYEATIPELQLDEKLFEEGFAKLLAEEPMTPEERAALENRYAKLYALVTRKERLDAVARNLAEHFLGVSDGLKAMVVCIDKATTLHLYKRVQDFMQERIAQLQDELVSRQPHERTQITTLTSSIAALKALEMAVILSQSEEDEKRYKERKLDVAWVRSTLAAMDAEVMAERFKRPGDPLRIVFVCSMWITGFDAPPVGVVYLDRPMRNHALMQTIARANRVFPGKEFGLVVDYIGVFKSLEAAFKDYAGSELSKDRPAETKDVVFARLADRLKELRAWCRTNAVDVDALKVDGSVSTAAYLELLREARDALAHPAERRDTFLARAGEVDRLFRALGFDARKRDMMEDWRVVSTLSQMLRAMVERPDLAAVAAKVEQLLDRAIDATGTLFTVSSTMDLTTLDVAAMARLKASKSVYAEAESLGASARELVYGAAGNNPTLAGLQQRLDGLIADYNDGVRGVEAFFDEVKELVDQVNAETARAKAEGLGARELVAFDVVLEALGDVGEGDEREAVREVARALGKRLPGVLVLDWRAHEQRRAAVGGAIEAALEGLPSRYAQAELERARDAVMRYLFEREWQA